MKGATGLLSVLVFFAAFVSLVSESVGDPLPSKATPMSPEEIKAFYVGHSRTYSLSGIETADRGKHYLAPNGRVIGVSSKGSKYAAFFDGSWSVSGNRLCMTTRGYELGTKQRFSGNRDCFEFYRVGTVVWVRWVVRFKGGSDGRNSYFRITTIKGDIVSKDYEKLRKRAGF